MRHQTFAPFEDAACDAISVYCSDGRFVAAVDEFHHDALGLRRYDRLVIPGGPACLAAEERSSITRRSFVDQLQFLIQAHDLSRVILIAHEDCGYYQAACVLPRAEMRGRQEDDLRAAAAFVAENTDIGQIDLFMARIAGRRIEFLPVSQVAV